MGTHFSVDILEKPNADVSVETELQAPRKFKVILINDDYTPMEFVVAVLQQFFYMSDALATKIMLQVHQQGRGICGVFTRDIAETKVSLVNNYSRQCDHPLLCCMEPE